MTNIQSRLFTVTLADQAPSIGSGIRFVFLKEGRKWVYLLNPFTMRTARLKWATWEGLKPLLINDDETRARVIRSVKANLAHAGRNPTRLERQAIGENHVA